MLAAAALGTGNLPSDPHSASGQYRINSNTIDNAGIGTGAFKLITFDIDKTKANVLKGTIEICIYDHSAATKDGQSTSWEIKNVTFIPD